MSQIGSGASARARFAPTLPAIGNDVIGRDAELAAVCASLDAGARMLTITGPGGVGKTTLAIEAATRVAERFGDDVVYVALSALADPARLLSAVAAAAGLELVDERSAADALRAAFADVETLLVIDNLEHLLAAATDIADLVDHCGGLHVLATSRVALDVRGEELIELAPLAVPAATTTDPGEVARAESVELLVRDVRRFDRGFAVTDSNAAAIGELCRRLDGLPLAIELAAARLQLLSPADLVAMLGRRLDVLRSPRRDVSPQQQTLRSTIEWSYRLLTNEEQQVLRTLAVFAGGFSLEAAADVASADAVRMLDHLATLVAHHLVVVRCGADGTRRFDLLESIRDFGRSELLSTNEADATSRAHCRWTQRMVDEATPQLTGAGQAAVLELLDLELDNVRAACTWALTQDGEAAACLAAALWRYWWMRGLITEGRDWLARAIAAAGDIESVGLARACRAAASLATEQSDPRAAEPLLERAALIFDRVGDETEVADCWNSLGDVARSTGDLGRAESLHLKAYDAYVARGESRKAASALNGLASVSYTRGELTSAAARWRETADLLRSLGDRRALGVVISNLAAALDAQDPEAMPLYEEALAIAGELGDRLGELSARINLGGALIESGAIDRGVALLEQSVSQSRELDDRRAEATALHGLACAAQARGEPATAGTHSLAALRLFATIGFTPGCAETLEAAARLAAAADMPGAALSMIAAAAALRDRDGSRPEADPATTARAADAAAARFDAETVAALEADGREWSVDEAIDRVRDMVAGLPTRLPAEPSAARLDAAKRVGLTRRELEVVDHLVRRRTDPEIAADLFVSVRTVTTHVSAVLRKLGVSSRRDVAARAAELGLVTT